MAKFNINSTVKVKLTYVGLQELKRQHDELLSKTRRPDLFRSFEERFPKDEEGYRKFQMWDLMERLGHLCGMGLEVPFETDILIDDGDLK